MPIYEYECLQCKKRTELLQRYGDAPLASCPECGSEVRKMVSAPSVQFKGSGWYVTDYAKKSGTPSGKSEKSDKSEGGSDSKSESTSESKSESKSEAKSEAKSESSSSTSESKSPAPAKAD